MDYTEADIKYEASDFWVLDVGIHGYQVLRRGSTHSTVVARIGHGAAPTLGLTRAITEADSRQAALDAESSQPPRPRA